MSKEILKIISTDDGKAIEKIEGDLNGAMELLKAMKNDEKAESKEKEPENSVLTVSVAEAARCL